MVEEEADLKAMAETDAVLKSNGWERTEESFKDTYGDGYERPAVVAEDISPESVIVDPGEQRELPAPDNDTNISDPDVAAQRSADLTESDGDEIDQLVSAMMARDGWRPLTPQMQAVIAAIDAAKSREELDSNLLTGLSSDDAEAMTQYLARASFATRIAAENELDR
jgi:hypothetical protein